MVFHQWSVTGRKAILSQVYYGIANVLNSAGKNWSMCQYGSGHETVAVLLPGIAINWWQNQVTISIVRWPDPYKDSPYQCSDSHHKDKMAMRPFYLYNGNPSTGEMTSIFTQQTNLFMDSDNVCMFC